MLTKTDINLKSLTDHFEIAERREDRKGQIYRSRGAVQAFYAMLVKNNDLDWQYMEKWSHSYRSVFVSKIAKATATYCEGDWILHISDDQESFEANIQHAIQFYEIESN